MTSNQTPKYRVWDMVYIEVEDMWEMWRITHILIDEVLIEYTVALEWHSVCRLEDDVFPRKENNPIL